MSYGALKRWDKSKLSSRIRFLILELVKLRLDMRFYEILFEKNIPAKHPNSGILRTISVHYKDIMGTDRNMIGT